MARRRELTVFSISFLDIISGALGAMIILYVAVPKANPLREELAKAEQQVRAQDAELQDLVREVRELRALRESAAKAIAENEELREQVSAAAPPQPDPAPESTQGENLEVGFKFKGRNIVFVTDTSRSMLDEDRMGQVKAGLKMLLTSMPAGFAVDVIQFPHGSRGPFRALYGQLKALGRETKLDAFEFIYRLKPDGATPTRDTLNYVFKTYPDLTDIVLLTDGEPSLHQSPLKDDIYDLLSHVQKLNKVARVQINTIGVGQEVLQDKTGRPYQFLRLLAEQNGGFFVGF